MPYLATMHLLLDFPVGLRVGGQQILLHPVFETLGIFTGFRYFLWQRKRYGDTLEQTHRVWIVIAATFGAVAGSRLLGALENPAALHASAHGWWYALQQKTLVGGLLGGLWAVEFAKKLLGQRQRSGDLFVYPLLLAMLIGRVGCFSMGVYEQTFGLPTQWPTGINLGDGLLRHPVALYEMAFLVLLWIWLKKIQPALPAGALFRRFMLAYLAFRFFLDFIKPHYAYGGWLSAIQIACLLGWLWYIPHWWPFSKSSSTSIS